MENTYTYKVMVYETYEVDQEPELTFERNYYSYEFAEQMAKEMSDYIANIYGTNHVDLIEIETNDIVESFIGDYDRYQRLPWLTEEIINSLESKFQTE